MRQVVAGAVVASSLAACRMGFAPSQDPLTLWQRMPLPPDPALAAKAVAGAGCAPSDVAQPIRIVLQDQRTPSTAAFLLAGNNGSGSCLLSLEGGSGGGWRSGPLEPMADRIVIDEQGGGGVGDGTATMLGGRIAPDITRVEIALSNGSTVTASVGNGHWLAWWPGGVLADRITGVTATGLATSIEWRDGGWSIP